MTDQAELEATLTRLATEQGGDLMQAVAALESMATAFLSRGGRPRRASEPAAQAPKPREPEAVLVLDDQGTVVGWSVGAQRLFGWGEADVVGRSVELLLAPGATAGVPQDGQLARRRDGTTFPLERTVCAHRHGGATLHTLVVGDQEARRRGDEELQRSTARYRMLVEQIPAVTFMAALDESENEIYIGPQIEALLGYSQREWLDDPVLWYWRMHQDDRQRWNEEFSRGIQTGGPFKNECRFYARDGRIVWVHGEARVVRDDDGRALFVQGVAFDITEQKRAEEKIREAQAVVVRTERLAAVGQLAAGVAHDLRNPLGAIRNAWHYLQKKLAVRDAADARVKQMAGIIDQELARCAQIIGELLDFSRSRPPFRVATPLHELLAEAARVVVRPHASTVVSDELPPGLPVPNVDRHQLRQVVVNLLQNAVEIVPREGGRVRVLGEAAAAPDGGPGVRLSVLDNGPGIPPDMREKVFEPLFTTKLKGTGLGLAVVDNFIRRHGGRVWVDEAPGGGAAFHVLLPVSEPTKGEAPAEGGAADLRDRDGRP